MEDKYLQEGRELLDFAQEEFIAARREHDEVRGREVCEKAYLAVLKALNAFFIKQGVSEAEVPQTERGRSFFLRRYGDRQLRDRYHALRSSLHLDGFHDGVIVFPQLEEDLNEVGKLLDGI